MSDTSIRDILARNLQRLREHESPTGELLSVRAWAMARELDVRLIDRLLKGDNAVKLDTLDEVARALGLHAWQLLLDDFDPEHPQTMPITESERKTLADLRRLLNRE